MENYNQALDHYYFTLDYVAGCGARGQRDIDKAYKALEDAHAGLEAADKQQTQYPLTRKAFDAYIHKEFLPHKARFFGIAPLLTNYLLYHLNQPLVHDPIPRYRIHDLKNRCLADWFRTFRTLGIPWNVMQPGTLWDRFHRGSNHGAGSWPWTT